MQSKEQSALLVHRENYEVPKGQERAVHFKIAKMNADGGFLEKPRIVKSRVKQFETVEKAHLENAGYTIEILFHPQGTYSNVRIVDKNIELANKDAEIAALKAKLAEQATDEKDAKIAKLEAEIAKLKGKGKGKGKTEGDAEGKTEEQPKNETESKKEE